MMGPIHDQRWSATGHIRPELRRTLHLWAEVLSSGLTERRVWRPIRTVALHIFCDASSRDARLGAVIWDTGVWYWTSTITPERVRASFCVRNDNQIMALELLAISLALATFEDRIRNRRIIVHCDNKGAEVSCNICADKFASARYTCTGSCTERLCQATRPLQADPPPMVGSRDDGARNVRRPRSHQGQHCRYPVERGSPRIHTL